jgi:hypothetical protein
MGGKRGTSGIGKSETVSRVNPSSKTMSGKKGTKGKVSYRFYVRHVLGTTEVSEDGANWDCFSSHREDQPSKVRKLCKHGLYWKPDCAVVKAMVAKGYKYVGSEDNFHSLDPAVRALYGPTSGFDQPRVIP